MVIFIPAAFSVQYFPRMGQKPPSNFLSVRTLTVFWLLLLKMNLLSLRPGYLLINVIPNQYDFTFFFKTQKNKLLRKIDVTKTRLFLIHQKSK